MTVVPHLRTIRYRVAIDSCFVVVTTFAPWWTQWMHCDDSSFVRAVTVVAIANLLATVYTRLPLSDRQRAIIQTSEALGADTRLSVYSRFVKEEEFRPA